jgi:protoheme IX farnesyltransferase
MAFWLREVMALFKLRLASLVVVSAVLGYLLGIAPGAFSGIDLLMLVLGGTLLTGASNALNQVFEVQEDGLMHRTAERPLVRRTLGMAEAIGAAFVAGSAGIVLLWLAFGPLTGILGFLSLFMYAALYTPLKKRSPWAVFIGAFPGAFPPMLGYVAAISVLALACSSPCNSCGNSRTSGPLRGCSMRIMHAAASACSPRPAAPMAAAPS